MKIERTKISDVLLLTPKVYSDNRGYFFESYRSRELDEKVGGTGFVQGNISNSIPWTLRGIHYQTLNPQGKLVSCVSGEIYDVAVDLRRDSPTFKQWVAVYLNAENHKSVWIPPGCGHAFLATSRGAIVQYECSTEYVEAYAHSIRWNDVELNIAWPLSPSPLENPVVPVMSIKDQHAPALADAELPEGPRAISFEVAKRLMETEEHP